MHKYKANKQNNNKKKETGASMTEKGWLTMQTLFSNRSRQFCDSRSTLVETTENSRDQRFGGKIVSWSESLKRCGPRSTACNKYFMTAITKLRSKQWQRPMLIDSKIILNLIVLKKQKQKKKYKYTRIRWKFNIEVTWFPLVCCRIVIKLRGERKGDAQDRLRSYARG